MYNYKDEQMNPECLAPQRRRQHCNAQNNGISVNLEQRASVFEPDYCELKTIY